MLAAGEAETRRRGVRPPVMPLARWSRDERRAASASGERPSTRALMSWTLRIRERCLI